MSQEAAWAALFGLAQSSPKAEHKSQHLRALEGPMPLEARRSCAAEGILASCNDQRLEMRG
jgi:hypothetical protein